MFKRKAYSSKRKPYVKSRRTVASLRPVSAYEQRPPNYHAVPFMKYQRFRYTINSAASAVTISANELLNSIGVVGNSTTNVTSVFNTFKLHRVRIWAAPAFIVASGIQATTTALLTWSGAGGSGGVDARNDSLVSASCCPDAPGYITAVPPRGCQASFWNSAGAQSMFLLSAPAGSILEIIVSATMCNGAMSVNPPTVAVITAVAGQLYFLALDGPGNNTIRPLGLNSTF